MEGRLSTRQTTGEFLKSLKKLIKYFELSGNVCFTHIFKLNLPIIQEIFF